jgi:hypothetical protein
LRRGVVGVADGLKEQARGWIARNDRRTTVAAAHQSAARVEFEATFVLSGAVAAVAMLDQNGADLGFKKLPGCSFLGGWFGTGRASSDDE